jgi:hypothetical protein
MRPYERTAAIGTEPPTRCGGRMDDGFSLVLAG